LPKDLILDGKVQKKRNPIAAPVVTASMTSMTSTDTNGEEKVTTKTKLKN